MPTHPPALVIVSHGSRRPGAADALEQHCDLLRRTGRWSSVGIGFVNAGQPAPGEAIGVAVQAGARAVDIVPWFLDEVRSVKRDLPPVIAAACARHPDVEFRVAQVIGRHPGIGAAVLELAEEATPAHADTPALVLAVHGSRDMPDGGASPVVENIRQAVQHGGKHSGVRVGWLSGPQPSIGEAIEARIAAGARAVVCVPLFLLAGSHVCRDIPAIAGEVAARHPGVSVVVSRHLGASPRMPLIVEELALAASRARPDHPA